MVAPLPPDISYGIECSVETFDITADVATFYFRFNEEPLAPRVDNHIFHPGDHSESLRGLSRLYMKSYNDWFWTRASEEERVWCVRAGVREYGRKAAEMADHYCHRFISDMLSQGRDPALRASQQVWLDNHRGMSHAEKITAQFARKLRSLPLDLLCEALDRPDAFYERLPAPSMGLFGPDTEWHIENREGLPPLVSRKPVSKSIMAKRRRKKMQVLKKSSTFLARLIGTHDVNLFVGGKEIRVEGQRFDFVLSKADILSENHGALNIAVVDRQTQNRMFNLCWYVERTPALDQISAMVMAVRAGDEDEIIRVGNILRVNHSVYADTPVMQEFVEPIKPIEPKSEADRLARLDREHTQIICEDEDRLFHLFPGSTEYHRGHPEIYQAFASRVAGRLSRFPVPDRVRALVIPHRPETVRVIADGRVGRELLYVDDIPLGLITA